jgi:M6 family metalloprotease-like protein
MIRYWVHVSVTAVASWLSAALAQEVHLADYRTVATAISAKEVKTVPERSTPGFLGVAFEEKDGKLVVSAVAAESPAAHAGIQPGDLLRQADGRDWPNRATWQALRTEKTPGSVLKLQLQRGNETIERLVTLAAPSRPPKLGSPRAFLGIDVEPRKDGPGVVIVHVAENSPAERAHLRTEEIILKWEGTEVKNHEQFRDLILARKPGDTVTLTMIIADKQADVKVTLGGESDPTRRSAWASGATPFRRDNPMGGNLLSPMSGGFDTRRTPYWTKDSYKLAIIIINYPDVKNNPKITAQAWHNAMFSQGTYKQTATGQPAFGSLYDYYLEQSYGRLRITGRAFEPVEVSKKRADYGAPGTQRSALLTEALDKLLERDGPDALKDFDGIIFIYAGGRMQVARGSLYWPHRSSVSHRGKRWPYFICPEGGERMANISVFAHEFGHMLGLPDLYARPENPGSEGLSVWCAMSNQVGNGRPQHFSAWCKEKLGWIQPTVLDPSVPQKLILGAINDSPKECFKVLVRPDGSEYFLLENRRKKGFDTSLPAEGLLIWRVVGNRPILEEAHGIEGPAGPRVYSSSVPYPNRSNDSFTPFTQPSSRSQLGGGLPVHITNIRRLPDGRIAFHIGYEYQ